MNCNALGDGHISNEKFYVFDVIEKKTVFAKGYILKAPVEKSDLKEIRDKYGHMFGGAGVYLFLTESCPDSEGRSKIYAGKAKKQPSPGKAKKRWHFFTTKFLSSYARVACPRYSRSNII